VTSREHFRRVLWIWIALSIPATLLVVLLLAPVMPPGDHTIQAGHQMDDTTILLGLSTPIAMAVLVWFIYSIIVFRETDPASVLEGPADRGRSGIQIAWIATTATIVLFLAVFGSVSMLQDGSGGGQGPNPIAKPDPPASAGAPLQIQVIAQQWQFTYRFPSYGGIETQHLELPANRLIEFHVTSLDVIHSWWAQQLGVKADANPGFDNVAYVQTKGPFKFNIRCVELCGVWHGYMFDNGRVVSDSDFASWIAQQQQLNAPILKSLPPYSKTYFPDPQRRGG
jgi:cytochrome c oxidase subunit 2